MVGRLTTAVTLAVVLSVSALPSGATPDRARQSTATAAQAAVAQPDREDRQAGTLAEPGDLVEATVSPDDPAVERIIEGESLADSATGAPTTVQQSCCGIVWSRDQQLRVDAAEVGDAATLTVDVPADGRYAVSADLTTGPDYGIVAPAVDGQPLGDPFDGYSETVALQRRVDLGETTLTEGPHTLALELTGQNAASTGLLAGLDKLRLRRLPDDGRLTLTPRDGAAVRGLLPIYGWSTALGDSLRVRIDGQDVVDRAALGDSATLLYEADGIQAGPSGADFAVGLESRGRDVIIHRDVPGFATDGIDIPGELLAPGANAITYKTGPDPAVGPDSNMDNFTIRNVRLLLPDGTVVRDESKPGSYALNDGDPEEVFTFDIPPTQTSPDPVAPPARGYVWDTSSVADGEHTVTITADGPDGPETRSATVRVDNGVPVITGTTPADGARVKGEVTLAATAEDGAAGDPALTATLDGEPVELGTTISSDDLADGEHTFTVTATDAAGNTATTTATFTSIAQTPHSPELVAPEDDATGLPTDPELRVGATDPDGDPLDVTFLEAAPVGGPPQLARAGATTGEPPQALNPDGAAGIDPQAVSASDDVYADAAPTQDFPYQRYDVAVDPSETAQQIDVSWEGRVSAEREVVLSVWDLQAQAWTPVASGMGDGDGDTTLVGTARLDRTLDEGVVHVLVQARDPFVDTRDLAPNGEFEDPSTYDFSIAWMTDTQYLSEGQAAGQPQFGRAYRAINEWIVENAQQRKIAYTAHTGDIINNWITVDDETPEYEQRAREEFQFARDTMDVLADAGMPFGVTPGNHDNKFGTANQLYNEYFPPSYFDNAEDNAPTGADGEGYYGGAWREGDNQNHYDLVEAGGEKLIFVYLGYVAGQGEIDWANQVLAEHSDRKAVFLTHEYLLPSDAQDGRGGELSQANIRSQGQELFEEVVMPNENVFLTLSGHTNGVALNIKRDVGVQGRTVVEMLANYQFFEVDGERRTGHFRLLQFNTEDSSMAVDTYSPVLDDHNAFEYDARAGRNYTPQADEFTVPVDLSSRTTSFRTDAVSLAVRTQNVIGSVSVASGEEAAVTWSGLEPGTEYGWYARASDEFGAAAESAVFTFRTDPCAASDTRPTVMIGAQDSGVENRVVADGCTTINDLIEDERGWENRGAFLRHVHAVTRDLVRDDVISASERRAILRAARRFEVGRA